MERTIQRIQPTKLAERKILRVAAYARVSCDKDAMKQSLAAQISYYSGIIQQHDGWMLAGVYADEACSGTRDNRPQFVRLIEDCKAGKVDRIITKSISRFARNTLTLLNRAAPSYARSGSRFRPSVCRSWSYSCCNPRSRSCLQYIT